MATKKFTVRFDMNNDTDARIYQELKNGADRENISMSSFVKNKILNNTIIDVDAIATAVVAKLYDMKPNIITMNSVASTDVVEESKEIVISDAELDFISGF